MQLFPRATHALSNFPGLWRRPTKRTVLVIGGAGYIGSALLPKLLARGHHVRVLDRLIYGMEPIGAVLGHPQLEIVQADFREIDKLVECMRDVDAVVHLGAIVGDPACALDRELTIEVNLIGTRTIAEVAKGYGIRRFVFASTCSVYGSNTGDELLNENSPLQPVSLYAVTKLASESVLLNLAGDNFSPTCLRFSTIYGLSGRIRFDLVVNLLTAKAVNDNEITIQGGDQWRPFLHVDDAALALLHTLESPLPLVHKQVFNVGSDAQNYTIAQIGELIRERVPTANLINLGNGDDRRNYRADFRKVREELGFMPRWNLPAGIDQMVELIRREQVHDYGAPRYSNVKSLAKEQTAASMVRHECSWANDLVKRTVIAARPSPMVPAAA